MPLPEELMTIIGDEEKAKTFETALGKYFVPKSSYGDVNAKLKKAQEDLAALSGELETTKSSSLTETEKLAKLQKALTDQQNALSMQKNRMDAERIFVAKGLVEDDYTEILESIVSPDAERTVKMANLFLTQAEKTAEKRSQAVREELLKGAPPAGGGAGNKPLTEEAKIRGLFQSQSAALIRPATETK